MLWEGGGVKRNCFLKSPRTLVCSPNHPLTVMLPTIPPRPQRKSSFKTQPTPSQASQYQISVGVRIRPPSKYECPTSMDIRDVFTPHHILPPSTSQDSSYDILTTTLLSRLKDGFSTSIIAYGQTGSGKTHTIFGPPSCLRVDAPTSEHGLLPRKFQEPTLRNPTANSYFPKVSCGS